MENLVLSFPVKNISGIKRIFSGNQITYWMYLGQDSFSRRLIEQGLGGRFQRIDIARMHNEIADDIRKEHVKWIDEINLRHGKNLDWWFNPVSSRNMYSSNLFQYCCYLETLKRIWKNGSQKPSLIIIESFGLAGSIMKWARGKNIKSSLINSCHGTLKLLRDYLSAFYNWFNFANVLFLRYIAAVVSKLKYKPKNLNVTPSVIIDTFVQERSLSDNGAFHDYYFPHLHDYLLKKGINGIIHPIIHGLRFNYFSIYNKMRKSNTLFIIPEDFLALPDYICALISPFKSLFVRIKASAFRGVDCLDMIREDQRRLSDVASRMQAVLIYRLFLNIKKAKLRPSFIIDWYENQFIDRALNAGARRAFPQIKIIGAQLFIHSPNMLHLFPSDSEVAAGITPDVLLETSEYQCERVKSFTKNIPCKAAASLRYSPVFENNFVADDLKKVKSKSILIASPININESIEILELIKRGLPQITKECGILIKTHPDYKEKDLINAFGKENWPERFKFLRGNIQEALSQVSLVIGSGSSSMVESAARGIPVILIGRQTVLNQNMLAGIKEDIITECFTVSELTGSIKKYLDLSSADAEKYKNIGRKIRDLFFTPLSEEKMALFSHPF